MITLLIIKIEMTFKDRKIILNSLNLNNKNSTTITNTGNIIIDGDIDGGRNNISEFNDTINIINGTFFLIHQIVWDLILLIILLSYK